ncbi:MAG TPA: 3-isopropylmalate dehydratase large subunit [Hyphomicrobiaceae bacterium]|nr:3-isopropylmalate dehydratase large subunit [Hyphomicrobiaceae bacterium]
MGAQTLFEKVWNRHVVSELGDGYALLYVSRHLMHDGGSQAFRELKQRGLPVRNPELTFATFDHVISTLPGRTAETNPALTPRLYSMRADAKAAGVRLFDLGEPGQGIVHVMGPELGLTLPGTLLVCGDSHTCTHGGMGALAFGIGSSEVVHVLATQTIVQRRPKLMRATFEGTPAAGVTAKDMILNLIGVIGAAGGTGYAVEYAGAAIRALDIEGRLTICNLSIELGAKCGMVAPDEVTFAHLKDRAFAPKGAVWEAAVADWRTLPSDPDAVFDREVAIDVGKIAPQITWGTSPEHVVGVDGHMPDPKTVGDGERRNALEAALDYMGLTAGAPIAGTPVDWVFIGSCTNSRICDLRAAASVAKGRRVAATVRAWVVPGSENVKRQAEAEGLDEVFKSAGFEWREPGCSMCVAMNNETVPPGQRSVSTSNRNFVGRQGPGARTHLASPAMAAAAALAGRIVDVRGM